MEVDALVTVEVVRLDVDEGVGVVEDVIDVEDWLVLAVTDTDEDVVVVDVTVSLVGAAVVVDCAVEVGEVAELDGAVEVGEAVVEDAVVEVDDEEATELLETVEGVELIAEVLLPIIAAAGLVVGAGPTFKPVSDGSVRGPPVAAAF